VLDPDDRPVAKGTLCAQARAFNLHASTKVITDSSAREPGGQSRAARPSRRARGRGGAGRAGFSDRENPYRFVYALLMLQRATPEHDQLRNG